METILHISDVHFGWDGDNPSEKADRKVCLNGLLTEISKLEGSWKPSIVCLTGDVGWRGTDTDYAEAKHWLGDLLGCCDLDYERLVVCPGNHDVVRSRARKVGRPPSATEADQLLELPLAEQYLKLFLEYTKFCTEIGVPAAKFGDGESHLVGERMLGDLRFVILNSSWFSKDDEDENKLWFGLPHLKYLEAHGQLPNLRFDGKEPVTVALMHHPPEWLHADEQHVTSLRPNPLDYLARRSHILLTGHTHGEVRRADRIAEGAWHFTGGSAYAGASHFNSFRLVKIAPHHIVYRSFEFDPRSSENNWESSDAVNLSLVTATSSAPPVHAEEKGVMTASLRAALRADAIRLVEQKSRLLRPFGHLPRSVPQQVSVRVSAQHEEFNPFGRLVRRERAEQAMPFYEATRESRHTLLLGDLGTGKSTLAAQLVVETIDRSETAVAAFVPVKALRLVAQFTQTELFQSIDDYIVQEVAPSVSGVKLSSILDHRIEVLLVLDGLDELARDTAARLLRQASALTEHWSTIQVVATARPIELVGVSYPDWRLIHTVALDDMSKQQFIREELVADGCDDALVDERATTLVRALKEMPTLDSLANSPLAIRLVYTRLNAVSSNKSQTLGDLLYELLLERLGGWQKRDDKPSTFDHLEAILPTAEAKAELLAVLAQKPTAGLPITVDEAKASLGDYATSLVGANKYRLAEEALAYFEWLGLIAKGDLIEFPLQPLAEVAAAVGLLSQWRSKGQNRQLPNHAQWRIVSFAAAVARRRGWLDELRHPVVHFIESLLREASNLPAACYVVVESNDATCAEKAVKMFHDLGHRPLTVFGDERRASARNVAKTLWLAGETGFDWLFRQYLDPRFPIPNAGSAIIRDVFMEWAAFVRGQLSDNQKERLAGLVMPYLATNEGYFFGVLETLAVLIPEAFGLEDRLWYQSLALDHHLFGDWVAEELLAHGRSDATQALLSKLLRVRTAESAHAGDLWLQLNPVAQLPLSLIRRAFASLSNPARQRTQTKLVSGCRERLGDERWLRFARWMLTVEGSAEATGAARVLHDAGENRLSVLGDVLMRALHDGGYVADAEKILAAIVKQEGDEGARWLASRIAQSDEWLGAYSGWWRVLLANLQGLDDGPKLLAACARSMGPFTLARYPEVREAFSRVLSGSRGMAFRSALRDQLGSLDPKVRRGAAVILVANDPRKEAEAVFVAIRSRAETMHSEWHEWESFCLTLDFAPSVLASLKGRLHLLEAHSRALAIVLLLKGGLQIDPEYRSELVSTLLTLGNWHLATEPAGRAVLGGGDSFERLLAQLDVPGSETAERAAEQLLDLHPTRLSRKAEAKCIAVRTKPSSWAWEVSKVMVRIVRDSEFASDLNEASQEIRDQGGPTPLLELVLRANSETTTWKDVVWAMLCDGTRPGSSSEADTPGETLIEYGLEVEAHRKPIGQAAYECLCDPRTQQNRWTDAYHWLAVIADEFVGLAPNVIREALTHSRPITCCAATALIARLGEVPEGVVFDRGTRRRPLSFAESAEPETDAGRLLLRLSDYARDSDEFHPALLETVEESLFLPALTEHALSDVASKGKPGALIATTLRFCYGLQPNLEETLPLLDMWSKLWNDHENKPNVKRLLKIWIIVRESAIRDDEKAATKYLGALDAKLSEGSIWRLPIASEILRIRGSLLEEQVRTVFLEYARHATFLHEMLFGQLSAWLAGDLDENLRNAVINATHDAIVILNEAPWDSAGLRANMWAYYLFPATQWALSGKTSTASDAVFLRGLSFSFDESGRSKQGTATDMTDPLSRLEPLLRKTPRDILSEMIRAGLDASEPKVRIYCRLIESFAELLTSHPTTGW